MVGLLEKVCKEIGVEIGEIWAGSDGYYYCISESGQVEVLNKNDELLDYGYVYWEDIFTGVLKPIWKPKEEEVYYIPNIKMFEDYKFHKSVWLNDDIDQWYLSNNMVFKTKEGAIEAANKMIKTLKKS